MIIDFLERFFMEPLVFAPESIAKFGISAVLIAFFLWLLFQLLQVLKKDKESQSAILFKQTEEQTALIAREREELKARVIKLELEVSKNHDYIQNELTELLKDNSKTLLQVNETITQQIIGYRELCDKIGKIGKAA